MIVKITRDDQPFGTIHCSPSTDDWGRIPTTVWFCPRCGRIYARETVEFEHDEEKKPLIFHVIERPCSMPLHDLTAPHPTLWNCADLRMMKSALKEYLDGDNPSKCPAFG